MRYIVSILIMVFFSLTLWAQSPEKISYQAVIRNNSNQLVVNQTIGMRISILQGSVNGTSVYTEIHSSSTNANGLVNIVIGDGILNNGDFSSIDWSFGPYFIKTETDPDGGANYTISGISQLLSVPYAFYAKTAENLTGTIPESDPAFSLSVAAGISAADTAKWNNKQDIIAGSEGIFDEWDKDASDDFDGYYSHLIGRPLRLGFFTNDVGYISTETDPVFKAWDKSTDISITESQISDLGSYLETESDPVFGSSVASEITAADTTYWNNKLDSYTETDPVFKAWDKSTDISITENQISNLGSYLETESDPVFGSSIASEITAVDTTYWNNKLDSYTETDPDFSAWDKSTGISITESQISDLGSYLETESDPVFGSSVASEITASDTTYWNNKLDSYTETDPDFSAWDKSTDISITESQISDLGSYLETESDPVFGSSVASEITASDTTYWNNKLDSYTETDPDFSVWDKSTGISITESQISDLGSYLETESDPVFGSSVASEITASDTTYWNNKLDSYTETDPDFSAWDKSTGISITESQISDLGSYLETESDPVFGLSVASEITAADTTYWNNKLDSYTETDPVFKAWDKSTDISITENQISDLGSYLETETDPVFGSSVASKITAADTTYWNNKLDSYTETQNLEQVLTQGTSAGDKNITNLANPVNAQDAATKWYIDDLSITDGTAVGQMLYWDGSEWVSLSPGSANNRVLRWCNGLPTWEPCQPNLLTTEVVLTGIGALSSGGTITDDGGAQVIAKGICWSNSPNPTISNAKTEDGSGMETYSSILTDLPVCTEIYVRAYATNSSGTSYGNEFSILVPSVAIGDSYSGGKVAYIYQPGDPVYIANECHGFIAAPSDNPFNTTWGCEGTSIPGTSSALGAGKANTLAIVNGCSTTGIAARICNDLVTNGYNDWYLPSKDELQKIYDNRDAIGGLSASYLWSSTQQSDNYAYYFWIYGERFTNYLKTSNCSFRAIRYF